MASILKRSRVRVSSLSSLFFFFFFFIFIVSLIPLSSPTKTPYPTHCSSLVPPSTPTTPLPTAPFLFSAGYFTGGDRVLFSDPNYTFSIPKSLSFRPRSLSQTLTPDTLHVAGTLTFRGGAIRVSHRFRRRLRIISPRNPRSFTQRGRVSFDLNGFWSGSSGVLCMVGTGETRSKEGIPLELSAVFKLNYPNSSNILTSVVAGVVESVDDVSSLNYYDSFRVLAYAQREYEFTKVSEALDSCSGVRVEGLLGFGDNYSCAYLRKLMMQKFKLRGSCTDRYCGPFARVLGFSPNFLSFKEIQCLDDGRLRMYAAFSDRGNVAFTRMLEPDKSLVVEGVWDQERKKLCLVACRVLNVSGSLSHKTADDCTIGLSLWFPSVLSIENVSMISGRIWSNLDGNDSKYFDAVSIGDADNHMLVVPGVKYKYTQMDRVKRYCARGDTNERGKLRYPDMRYIGDMRFDMYLTNPEGKSAWGYANPRFVGEELYSAHVPSLIDLNHSFSNVSYKIGYTFHNASVYAYEATEITAEGTYEARTGMLCMVGCRHFGFSMDCEIQISVQLAPLNPMVGVHLTGVIRSTREKLDPLFFKPLEISSYEIYKTQAAKTIRWMDIEIIMGLISLTLSCIFIGLQLFHIKKNPDVLPSLSITMLVVLTLGHMIPLVLTFEALFSKNRNQQNGLLQSGGWLQMHEVVLRVITMVAFLLLFRLLQIAWSSRAESQGEKRLWVAERKTLLCCLPLYIVGGLVALVVHLRNFDSHQNHHSLWEDLMSYAGFILDSFLFPQFIFNIFYKSKDKSLAPSFYLGTSVVRALPHVYDAYRAHHYIPQLNSSYIYASRNGDLYSSAWDIIIPCEVLVLAMIIYLQQRFGGVFILPQRIKEAGGYEMVPVVNQ